MLDISIKDALILSKLVEIEIIDILDIRHFNIQDTHI